MPLRDIIDVDAMAGFDRNKPVDLTVDSDEDEVSLIPSAPQQRLQTTTMHQGCSKGPRSTIKDPWAPEKNRSKPHLGNKRSLSSEPHKSPLAKKQRVDLTASLPRKPAPKDRKVDHPLAVIDISDGEEPLEKHFKVKKNSSDDEYEAMHAGYELSNPENWNPVKINKAKIDFELVEESKVGNQSPAQLVPKHRALDFSTGVLFDQSRPRNSAHIWEILRMSCISRPTQRPLAYCPPSLLSTRLSYHNPHPFKLTHSFKKAPGGINRIVQSGPYIGMATAATGGGRDIDSGDTLDPYNRKGAAMIWKEGSLHQLHAHVKPFGGGAKQYTVNDIKFDAANMRSVTTGNDRGIEIWTYETKTPIRYQDWDVGVVPNEIAFKPDSSVYAVAERKVRVYSTTSSSASEQFLYMNARCRDMVVGSMIWGRGPTSTYLYVSTEPPEGKFSGNHKGFDVEAKKPILTLDNEEGGDAMAITSSGNTLALFTCASNTSNYLRLYDVRVSNPKAISTTKLLPFPSDIELGEVLSAGFRDDGIYLAVGRNDNHIHVYDARMQDRLLFDYSHWGAFKNSPGNKPYGITHLEWVDGFTSSLSSGIISGGTDGCIRLWDPCKSDSNEENGVVLAETTSDIGYFSVGDRFKGEHDLVVGDCAGEVYFFDTSRNEFLWKECQDSNR